MPASWARRTSVECELSWQRETSETPGFDRTITVGKSGEWSIKGRAFATHGPALDQLFAPLSDDQVKVVATSTYGGDPAVAAAGALDGRPETGWTSAPGDPAPALQLTWGPRRKVSASASSPRPASPASCRSQVVVDGGPGTGRAAARRHQWARRRRDAAGAHQPAPGDGLRPRRSRRRRHLRAAGGRDREPAAPPGPGDAHRHGVRVRADDRGRWPHRPDPDQRHDRRHPHRRRPRRGPVRQEVGRAAPRASTASTSRTRTGS